MAALAGMFKERGLQVTGSDAMAYPPVSTLLEKMNISILLGYDARHLEPAPDLVIVGNVCHRDNPEVLKTLALGIPHMSLPEALRLIFMKNKLGVVITGTHGKTTTSALTAWLLAATDNDPSYMIGGIPGNFGSNYLLGNGPHFVIEGDEYDTAYFDKVPKFWHYPTTLATINNVEFDHADIYEDIGEIERVFTAFARQVSRTGSLWVNGDDERALEIAKAAVAKVGSFGLTSTCDAYPINISHHRVGCTFELIRYGESMGEFHSPMWGEHNLRNTMGALLMAYEIGVESAPLKDALTRFRGVVKRQEVKGEEGGVLVIDDFAHHPTAVRETLKAVRDKFPKQRIWTIFEAKTNTSRRAVFQKDYATCFDRSDHVILSQPWKKDALPEAEKISIPQLAKEIASRGPHVDLIENVEDIVSYLRDHLEQGDVVLGLSGGDFGGLHNLLLDALRSPS
jgi:UDP-N-acetylmuramate: L-alanyl-gamma-D-glutamyl-meso-diaminopimelate ligase